MKKTKIMFQKKDGLLRPAYHHQFEAIQEITKEEQWLQAEFSEVKKTKTPSQLGYIFGVVYPFMLEKFKEGRGFVSRVQFGDDVVETTPNIENVDTLLKHLFSIKNGGKQFNKTEASREDIASYIDFLDYYSIQNFQECIPEALKKEN